MRHAGLHRTGGDQHLGHEDDVVAELDADYRHAGDQAVVEDRVGGIAVTQALFREPVHLVVVADDQLVGDLLEESVTRVELLTEVNALTLSGDVLELFLKAVVDYRHPVTPAAHGGPVPAGRG